MFELGKRSGGGCSPYRYQHHGNDPFHVPVVLAVFEDTALVWLEGSVR